jgi:hypothetical protein
MATKVSSAEFQKLKAQATLNIQPEGPELIEGKKYYAFNLDLIQVRKIDKENDKLHIFNHTQNCNVYPKLSTFRAKKAL